MSGRPGNPADNAHIESFKPLLREGCPNTSVFESLESAEEDLRSWRSAHGAVRPSSATGMPTPGELAEIGQRQPGHLRPAFPADSSGIRTAWTSDIVQTMSNLPTASAPGDAPMTSHCGGLDARTTIVLPVRIDSPDRFENMLAILRFLDANLPDAEKVIVESDIESVAIAQIRPEPSYRMIFLQNSGRFSKAQAINAALLATSREIVVVYDVDVLASPIALRTCASNVAHDPSTVWIPHNGIVLDIMGSLRSQAIAAGRSAHVPHHPSLRVSVDFPEMTASAVPGGVFCAARRALLECGGYNDHMISYGWEDIEIFKRMHRLGFARRMWAKHSLVHLHHRRGHDSRQNEHFDRNRDVFNQVMSLSLPSLCHYVRHSLAIGRAMAPTDLLERARSRRLRNMLVGISLMSRVDQLRFIGRRSRIAMLLDRALHA